MKNTNSLLKRLRVLEQKIENNNNEDIETILIEWFNFIEVMLFDKELNLTFKGTPSFEEFRDSKILRKEIKEKLGG